MIQVNRLEEAVKALSSRGHSVERADFPPAPLPALFVVDGRELTEMQVIHYAEAKGK